ncbi:MAG: DUF72 domain-containing protein [Candidatus Kapaibacteriales bacterium]
MSKFFVGTSGWSFNNWRGIFYPEALPQSEWLKFYSNFFNCVEVNSTFYRNFSQSTYKRWAKSVPDGFSFILKAPKEITHNKKFTSVKYDIIAFLDNIQPLESKLGLVLLQFPPNFKIEYQTFNDTIRIFREKVNVAVELRNTYAFAQDTIEILINNDCTIVNADSPKVKLSHLLTSKTMYYRLHGKPELHKSSYSSSELQEIVDVLFELKGRIQEAYIIFNNGLIANSIYNGIEIQKKFSDKRPFNEFLHTHYPKLGL